MRSLMPRSLVEVVLAERQRRRRAQRRPVVAADREEPAPGLDHAADPTLAPWPALQSARRGRKRRGDYPTPPWLVDLVVASGLRRSRAVRRRRSSLDPACGDGRFLAAAAAACAPPAAAGGRSSAWTSTRRRSRPPRGASAGVRCRARPRRRARPRLVGAARFDVVVGNPPYLSQLAAATTRRRRQPPRRRAVRRRRRRVPRPRRSRCVRPGGGRIGLVLPQSILASRDAAPVRAELDRAGDDHVVVVVAAARVRRPGARVRARLRGSADARRRRPASRWSRRRDRRARRAGAAGAGDRRDARRPGPADGELPRPVLRARARPSSTDGDGPAARDERARSTPGRCRVGSSATCTFARRRFAPPDRRARPARARRCGAGPTACSCPRSSWPTRRGSSRPSPTPTGAGCRACPLITARPAAGVDPWRARRGADVAGRQALGVAPRRRHRACPPASVRLGPRWLATCRGRPGTLGAGRRRAARRRRRRRAGGPCRRRTASIADARRRGSLDVVGATGLPGEPAVRFPAHRHTAVTGDGGIRCQTAAHASRTVACSAALGLGAAAPARRAGRVRRRPPTAGWPGADDAEGAASSSPGPAGCAACHGADGAGRHRARRGPTSLGTDVTLDDGTHGHGRRGLPDAVDRRSGRPGRRRASRSQMPQNQLTDDEVADLVAYIVVAAGRG